MRGYAVARNNLRHIAIALAILGAGTGAMMYSSPVAAQSMVSAIICGGGAELAVTSPQSDSVVTSPELSLEGTVKQSGQIEVAIDGAFNSVIPLAIGQTTFQSTVQLTQGTHTVTLTAIDSCESTNATVSVVVTYTSPPSTGSTGASAQTGVTPESDGGVRLDTGGGGESIQAYNPGGLLPAPLAHGLQGMLEWLNISVGDTQDTGYARLSLIRAFVMSLGIYMAVIGVAQTVVSLVAATPLFKRFHGDERLRVASRVLRIVGIILIVAAFVV